MTTLKECSDSTVHVAKADLLSWDTLFRSQIVLYKCVKTLRESRKKNKELWSGPVDRRDASKLVRPLIWPKS